MELPTNDGNPSTETNSKLSKFLIKSLALIVILPFSKFLLYFALYCLFPIHFTEFLNVAKTLI